MSYRLNKLGYQQLIAEDIAWLERFSRTLERDHIIMVLQASIEHEYPSFTSADLTPPPCETHGEPYCDCDK